ncbi:MAG: 1-acyl-sn-glycerol-3-phosphate acyltransferase [Polyangiaceae bacterium]
MPGAAHASIRWFFRRVIQIYFREIEIVGEIPRSDVGGRLFAANHVNGLVDPILVLTTAPCAISPLGKAPLWKIPVLRWLLDAVDAVPIVRRRDDPNKNAAANDEVFEKVAAHLTKKGNILIFPEGTSHNEPHLITMRSGGGRMLAHAKDAGTRGLTFQAVGLEFEERDVFRSRSLLMYGPVRSVDAITDPDLAGAITKILADDLSELIVEGDTWEERILIARVAEMFANEARDHTLEGVTLIGQRVEAAKKLLAPDDPTYRDVATRVSAYYAELERAGVGDEEVAKGELARKPGGPFRAIGLVLALPLAIAGIVLYWPPYQVPRIVARKADEADVVSTYKLGAGLVVHPLWAAVLVGLAVWFIPGPWLALAIAIILLSPFAALAWLDRAERLQRRVRSSFSAGADIERLGAMRRAAMERLIEARTRWEAVSATGT